MEGLVEQLELLPELLSAHLSLTLLALFVATAVSVPLGIASTRIPTLERFAVGTASVIQTGASATWWWSPPARWVRRSSSRW